jgi:alpha-glucosidase
MKTTKQILLAALVALVVMETACAQPAEQRSRRSQRVKLPEVQVASPDGRVKFTVLPNPERVSFTVTFGNTTVIEPSALVMRLDGFDLSAGVVFSNTARYTLNETYPWHGAHSTATNQCNGARISLQHDLSMLSYTLEIRAFNDGVAYRHIIPGEGNT